MTQDNARKSYLPLVGAVREFMRIGNQTTKNYNARQACLYTGLQFEELAEKVLVIADGCVTPDSRDHMRELHAVLKQAAKEFKAGLHEGDLLRCTHKDLIDADFDLAWVSIGALFSESVDAEGAIAHGTFTNHDKFRGGVATKDVQGKIQKPADWQRPDFEPYTDKFIRN